MTFSFTKRITAGITILVLLAQPLTARQVASGTTSTPTPKSTSVSVSGNARNDMHRWKTSNGFDNFNVEYRGKIEITDDDKAVMKRMLVETQTFMRSKRDECSFVSLRDIERVLQVTVWFISKKVRHLYIHNIHFDLICPFTSQVNLQ